MDASRARRADLLHLMPSVLRSSAWLTWAAAAAAACSGPYEDCFNSTCCANGNFGCKKRQSRQYAQCRPMPAQGCVYEAGWECPGWENCAEEYGECLDSKCCKDPTFGCYRRPERSFAQCKPLPTVGECTDTAEWRCPGWELCADTHQPCTSSHCCADARDVCYQKRPFYAQCMRRGTCVAGADATCTELKSSVGQCSAAYQDCHLTACCERGEDHCFLKNDNYGKCMPRCDAGACMCYASLLLHDAEFGGCSPSSNNLIPTLTFARDRCVQTQRQIPIGVANGASYRRRRGSSPATTLSAESTFSTGCVPHSMRALHGAKRPSFHTITCTGRACGSQRHAPARMATKLSHAIARSCTRAAPGHTRQLQRRHPPQQTRTKSSHLAKR